MGEEPASSAGIRFSSASSVASTTATGAPPVNTIQYNTILKANDVKNWCVSAAGAVTDPNTKENIECSYQHVVVNCSELTGMQLGEWLA
ncbi:hypothetical protein H0H93_016079 [Arthromyces matolae]|nr:hypothetical protein H0H93_016079 [Arthromyces matolae]